MRILFSFISILLCGIIFNCQAQQPITAIENVHVIPMYKDTLLLNHRILIRGNRILQVAPNSNSCDYEITRIIDGKGSYILPGLCETHFHQQNDIQNEFKLLIANGITSVRNMAEFPGQDQILIKNQVQNDEYLAPHYYTAGPYLKREHFAQQSVQEIVNQHRSKGYDYIKLADNLPKKTYLALLKSAKEAAIPLIGHGQRRLPLRYTLRMKSIAHMEEFLNIIPPHHLTVPKKLKNIAQQIKSSGVYVSPTLGTFDMISNYANPEKTKKLHSDPSLEYLPENYKNYWMSDSINYRSKKWFTNPESLARLQREFNWQQQFTHILHKAGVPLMAGSDTYGLFVAGFSLHKELSLLHQSGLSTYETLKTATVVPARYFNNVAHSGTIEAGKLANLIMLAKNPLENIENTQTVIGVYLKGQWHSEKLLKQLLHSVKLNLKSQHTTH